MASEKFFNIARRLKLIETNLAQAKKCQAEELGVMTKDWPGFYSNEANMFDTEIVLIDNILRYIANTTIKLDSWTKTRIRDVINNKIWPGENFTMGDIYDIDGPEFHEFLDSLIEASGYYRYLCERLTRSTQTLKREFKERAYAPGGALMQRASQRFQARPSEPTQKW